MGSMYLGGAGAPKTSSVRVVAPAGASKMDGHGTHVNVTATVVPAKSASATPSVSPTDLNLNLPTHQFSSYLQRPNGMPLSARTHRPQPLNKGLNNSYLFPQPRTGTSASLRPPLPTVDGGASEQGANHF